MKQPGINIKKWVLITLVMVFNASVTNAQKNNIGNNYVIINPDDSYHTIIEKAANIAPSSRQLTWQEKELTAFVHFGMNTFTGREWGTGKESPELFDPKHLNADQWVKVLKDAGFKQVILTAKHHDGFCLWPSKYTKHSVKYSPWKNGKGDVVRDVSNACKKYQVGFGVYLSPWDRNCPFYGDTKKYNQYFENQLHELLTNYGQVEEVWFDGANGTGPNGKIPVYDFNTWYKIIRKLQPHAVIAVMGPDVRWVGTETGYGRESEWSVVPVNAALQKNIAAGSQQDLTFKPNGDMTAQDLGGRDKIIHAKALIWYPAEADVSIRPGWFYHKDQDSLVKSPQKLLDIYYGSVGRNCVLLLNVPPDKEGLISKYDIKNLEEWTKLRDETFKTNLAKDAVIKSANGINGQAMLDGNNKTYWTTQGNDTTATIEVDLKGTKTFNVFLLQEEIRIGQRIEKFELDYWDGNKWKIATEGTTVGYKRLLQFGDITTEKVRLKILSSRLNPTIAEIGLYYQPISEKN
ncbi:MAG TPA: alpha-L-fucosidase [Hanamia sp.]|nr:alpha-L-fucosidase [Hanamia sp.]